MSDHNAADYDFFANADEIAALAFEHTQRKCPYCGAPTRTRRARDIYHNQNARGKLLVCSRFPVCDSYVGIHANGAPKGTLADKPLRRARMTAHAAFDPLWQSERMSRSEAYAWLAKALGLPPERTHIGLFTTEQCAAVVQACALWDFA